MREEWKMDDHGRLYGRSLLAIAASSRLSVEVVHL